MFDTVRYLLALMLLIFLPPAYLFWLVVHPWIGVWRRLGPTITYAVMGVVYLGLATLLYVARARLLRIEFGTQPVTIVLGAVCLAVAVPLRIALRRNLSIVALVGLPELAPAAHPGRLITDGVYARMRHPRYVEGTLGVLGCALIANHLAPYVVIALSLPALYCIVLLEERELRDRFGAAYADYCRRVPRFIPRLRGGNGS